MTDTQIIRELAKEYAQVAALPVFAEKAALYRGVNDLNMIRPIVLMDELPWHELNTDGSLDIKTESKWAQGLEQNMRRTLWKWRNLPCDMIVPNYINCGRVYANTGLGVGVKENVIRLQDGNHIVSHEYIDQFANDEDIEKIQNPVITADDDATKRQYNMMCELFDGIIEVRLGGVGYGWAPWDMISFWRGVTPLLTDLYDRPAFMHRMMERLLAAAEAEVDQYEALGLIGAPQQHIHCTAGLSSQLPAHNSDQNHRTTKDLWGRGTAQIFAHVSKEMHDEFDTYYMRTFMKRFGLVYYGCCEPLDKKMDIIKTIPNLRKVSVTPWADPDVCADALGSEYVLASKPNPAYVAVDGFDEDIVRKEILRTLDACRRNGTPCEFVLKDISTSKHRPDNLIQWAKVAMETVEGY